MRLFSLAALVLPIAVTQAITIVGPSESAFWVFNATNTITWEFSQGDPNPINIQVVNANNMTLNGAFSIASAVNVSTESFTVTNVTLVPGDGYVVQFVNGSNPAQIFANSSTFTVKPNGTAPAASVTPSSSGASSTATSPTSSGSGTSSSASSTGAANNTSGALSTQSGLVGVLAACGVASLGALFL